MTIVVDPTDLAVAKNLYDRVISQERSLPMSTGMLIEVDRIDPNPEQPRKTFDQAALESLAQSIKENGVIQPITVEMSPDGQRYILHDGERRWRAAKLAGLQEIPAYITGDQVSVRDRLTRAVVANVQREDLSPLEVAHAYQQLHDLGLTDQQIADKVGRSRSSITNARRLLDLPAEAQELATIEDISERSLAALLPMYQVPPENLAKLEEGYMWNKPSEVLKKIRQGEINSDDVRDNVSQIIKSATVDLAQATFPLDHIFDEDGLKVHSPRCDRCPNRVRSGKDDLRCPHQDCFQAKTHRWQADALQAASEASGIPPLAEETDYWGVQHFVGASETLLGYEILAAGCENLRLEYKTGASGVRLKGHEDKIRIVCHHGKDKSCKCLRSAKAKQTRNNPDRVAECEAKARLKTDIVEPYAAALAQAIADGQLGVWLRILRNVAYNFKGKGGDLTLDDIRSRIATAFVEHAIPYDGHQRLDAALQAVQRSFDEMGLPYPGQTEQSVPQDLAGAYETLDTLHRLMISPLCDLSDFEHVSWLVTVPSSDGNFKGHLERASHWVIQYALALVDGRDGHKVRIEALERQLQRVRAQTQEAIT